VQRSLLPISKNDQHSAMKTIFSVRRWRTAELLHTSILHVDSSGIGQLSLLVITERESELLY
jgi:hypothetical protein